MSVRESQPATVLGESSGLQGTQQALLREYEERGFLFLEQCFTSEEIAHVQAELPPLMSRERPQRVMEKDGRTVRSVYGAHLESPLFARLCRDRRILETVHALLGGDVYIYQVKLNAKMSLAGDVWVWHQDFIFWLKEDGTPAPRLVSVAIFMDEVTEFNGPLLLIPGSHREGVIEVSSKDQVPAGYEGSPQWISNLTADLKYTLDRNVIERLVRQNGIVAPKGPPGSVLFFHPNLFHASGPNLSPFDRMLGLITYNRVDNAPAPRPNPRPDFLCGRDLTPLQPLEPTRLLEGLAPRALEKPTR
jgi:ectoine hydroxylase